MAEPGSRWSGDHYTDECDRDSRVFQDSSREREQVPHQMVHGGDYYHLALQRWRNLFCSSPDGMVSLSSRLYRAGVCEQREGPRVSAWTPKPIRGAKIPSLDGVRAVSFLMVFVAHAGLDWIVPGRFGVNIFFALSGYLITSLLIREQENNGYISLKLFYLRRILRILPPMYAVLFVAACFFWSTDQLHGVTIGGVCSQIFYYQNYYHGRRASRSRSALVTRGRGALLYFLPTPDDNPHQPGQGLRSDLCSAADNMRRGSLLALLCCRFHA